MKLRQVRLITDNVPALSRFYRQITGAGDTGNDLYREFEGPVGNLAISSQGAMVQYWGGAAPPRAAVLDFEVADVDRERARLAAYVSDFVLEPTDQPWGNRAMLFRDPDGNLVNFFAPAVAATR